MKIELLKTLLPVEMLLNLRENGLCIKMDKTDNAFVRWGKERENYYLEHGNFPTYTAIFDSYPVFIGDKMLDLTYQYKSECDKGTPVIQGDISNIMAPILDTLQGYIDKCENGELTDADCLHQLNALWLEQLTLDTDNWTITPTFGC